MVDLGPCFLLSLLALLCDLQVGEWIRKSEVVPDWDLGAHIRNKYVWTTQEYGVSQCNAHLVTSLPSPCPGPNVLLWPERNRGLLISPAAASSLRRTLHWTWVIVDPLALGS